MSLQSVYEARKGPSSSGELNLLRVCIEMLGKVIDELNREIFVFMHKTSSFGAPHRGRYAEVKRVVVTDSEEDNGSNSDKDDKPDYDEVTKQAVEEL
jgi:hypothetical protein